MGFPCPGNFGAHIVGLRRLRMVAPEIAFESLGVHEGKKNLS
jgi:hypothetical protein